MVFYNYKCYEIVESINLRITIPYIKLPIHLLHFTQQIEVYQVNNRLNQLPLLALPHLPPPPFKPLFDSHVLIRAHPKARRPTFLKTFSRLGLPLYSMKNCQISNNRMKIIYLFSYFSCRIFPPYTKTKIKYGYLNSPSTGVILQERNRY